MSTTGLPYEEQLTERQLQAWRGMLEVTAQLRALTGARLQAVSALSEADYVVLLALTEAGDKNVRSSELADLVSWERSRVSHHLGRMERRGLVRRDACPTDSRGSELRVTEAGATAIRAATGPHLRHVKSIFADALTDTQIESLAGIVDALANHLCASAGAADVEPAAGPRRSEPIA